MTKENESPEERRERLRQKELKNPSSSIHGSNLADLVGGLGWKGFLLLIILLIIILLIFVVT
ncbi:DUF6366 family protein [Pseudogracilibacillus sp. SO10305]|uniref:DUF6366 family protein n=1 Tax=Pseudogracilibacillus sp. SO10305 TaxID=3098292 RepID=UPI00300E2AA3